MFGTGLPTASHTGVVFSPNHNTWSLGRVTIAAGSDQIKGIVTIQTQAYGLRLSYFNDGVFVGDLDNIWIL